MTFDRGSVADSGYLVDTTAEHSNINSKKNLWVVGLLIGFSLNFVVFVVYYIFHKREYLKRLSSKI